MRYVIFRDDDLNALTPIECLERLYRPFLDRGMPVNLATIPNVSTRATQADGAPEGFLTAGATRTQDREAIASDTIPIGSNRRLIQYLSGNPGFKIVQHGYAHDYLEFDSPRASDLGERLDYGKQLLQEAGLPEPLTFVAPYDKLSRLALLEVAQRFRVLSTGWFEWRRLPFAWWPQYALKKLRHAPHWRIGRTLLLSHPGCLLSCHRAYSTMLDTIIQHLATRRLTVLVTHWWEYFRDGKPDERFIGFLHQTASYVASQSQLKVISFNDLVNGGIAI